MTLALSAALRGLAARPAQAEDIGAIDTVKRWGKLPAEAERILSRIWQRPIRKQDAMGVHSTLFYGLARRKAYFAGKRDQDIDPTAINEAQRRLFEKG